MDMQIVDLGQAATLVPLDAVVDLEWAPPVVPVDLTTAPETPAPPAGGGYAAAAPVGGVLVLPVASTILVDLTAPVTSVLLPHFAGDVRFFVYLRQDASGGRSVGGWPSNVSWVDGVPPQLTLSPEAIDCLVLDVVGAGVIGAHVAGPSRLAQPLDPTLSALAATTAGANELIYAIGADTFAATPLTAFGRQLLAASSAAALPGIFDTPGVLDGGNF